MNPGDELSMGARKTSVFSAAFIVSALIIICILMLAGLIPSLILSITSYNNSKDALDTLNNCTSSNCISTECQIYGCFDGKCVFMYDACNSTDVNTTSLFVSGIADINTGLIDTLNVTTLNFQGELQINNLTLDALVVNGPAEMQSLTVENLNLTGPLSFTSLSLQNVSSNLADFGDTTTDAITVSGIANLNVTRAASMNVTSLFAQSFTTPSFSTSALSASVANLTDMTTGNLAVAGNTFTSGNAKVNGNMTANIVNAQTVVATTLITNTQVINTTVINIINTTQIQADNIYVSNSAFLRSVNATDGTFNTLYCPLISGTAMSMNYFNVSQGTLGTLAVSGTATINRANVSDMTALRLNANNVTASGFVGNQATINRIDTTQLFASSASFASTVQFLGGLNLSGINTTYLIASGNINATNAYITSTSRANTFFGTYFNGTYANFPGGVEAGFTIVNDGFNVIGDAFISGSTLLIDMSVSGTASFEGTNTFTTDASFQGSVIVSGQGTNTTNLYASDSAYVDNGLTVTNGITMTSGQANLNGDLSAIIGTFSNVSVIGTSSFNNTVTVRGGIYVPLGRVIVEEDVTAYAGTFTDNIQTPNLHVTSYASFVATTDFAGMVNIYDTLNVTGEVGFNNTITAYAPIIAIGGIVSAEPAVFGNVSVIGTSSFNNTVTIRGGLNVPLGRVIVAEDVTAYAGTFTDNMQTPNLHVTSYASFVAFTDFAGPVNMYEILNVTGEAGFNSTVTMYGPLNLNNALRVSGTSTFQGTSSFSSLNVTGQSGFNGTVTMYAQLNANGGIKSSNFIGPSTFSQSLTVSGPLIAQNITTSSKIACASLEATGNMVSGGDITVNGVNGITVTMGTILSPSVQGDVITASNRIETPALGFSTGASTGNYLTRYSEYLSTIMTPVSGPISDLSQATLSWDFSVLNNQVTMVIPALSTLSQSSATTFQYSGYDNVNDLKPSTQRNCYIFILNGGSWVVGRIQIEPTGTIYITPSPSSGNFQGSGDVAWASISCVYSL